MSFAMTAIVERLVERLVQDEQLLLAPQGTKAAVCGEILDAMAQRTRPAQLGAFFSGILVRSEHVEELFIDDASLSRLLSDL
jgi:anthranilate phosphoribosyltransferase